MKRLKQKNKTVNVILADAKHIPLQPQLVDAVFMIEVLDYIADLDMAFSECS
ncbi:MAG: class I SAM-dependent methyltransferase [Candidatus Bathyarchaeota archaeon]|nr:class I SAM-dependent methyltransferase [Candidatus Bathyarchaeota archaeon]